MYFLEEMATTFSAIKYIDLFSSSCFFLFVFYFSKRTIVVTISFNITYI